MTNAEKASIILQESEYYLQFDTPQSEYIEKGILKALLKIERIEKMNFDNFRFYFFLELSLGLGLATTKVTGLMFGLLSVVCSFVRER